MSASVSMQLDAICDRIVENIKRQMESRAYRVSNELRNSELDVLRGQGGGRRYRVPGTRAYYTASAPGQPPAVRTGAFRLSWQPSSRVEGTRYVSRIETNLQVNGYTLGSLLENGTSKMAPRPHHDRILEKTKPRAVKIYSEPYF